MRSALAALIVLGIMPAAAHAQGPAAPTDPDKVRQVIVYGEDPCPASKGDEITVCARMPEGERYRIPRDLRTDPNDPKFQSWVNRASAIEYVGQSGTDSCSPTGAGGFTGCFAQIAKAAKAERKAMMGDASWAELVAKERQKRLSTIDAESQKIEDDVKAAEAAEAAKKSAAAPGK